MPKVVIIGSHLQDKGGIVSVLKNVLSSSLVEKYDFKLIPSYINKSKAVRVKMFIRAFSLLRKELKHDRPDIVHLHASVAGSFYRKALFILYLKKKGIPTVLHIHGSRFESFYTDMNPVEKKLSQYILRLNERVIVLSDYWKEFFRHIVPLEKIAVIENGIALKNYTYDKSEIPVNFLFMGRLGDRKGVYDLVEACGRIAETNSGFHVHIAGDGEVEKVAALVKKKNLEHCVHVLGWAGEKEREMYLQKADVMVLPSYNEGFPMAILEAMNYGTAVISTRVGGIPEMITEGTDGFIIDPGDVEALTERMKLLLERPELRELMGKNNMQKVREQFDVEVQAAKIDKIYQNILNN
ncbi:glycosyltransferase family 4 protein [uncultured Marinococcus sp.]|uniref:glycosyltransferase family 4 protein n=1 Tax=uncultured Marinococcus sp. TaxID=487012 RepID=UPI00262C1DBC|nr:glycosyltransferase family 4 protein [uncultured Marinococcus sp.]